MNRPDQGMATSADTEMEDSSQPTKTEPEPALSKADSNTIQTELDKFKDLALRSQAELENYRKRTAREKEDTIRYANTSLLERLLPVIDNFELGLEAAEKNGSDSASILAGMRMIHKQLSDLVKDCGAKVIEAVGQPFDPNLHEAVGSEHSDEIAEGRVIRQLRSGYKLWDRLLRPSMVVVSKGASKKGLTERDTTDT